MQPLKQNVSITLDEPVVKTIKELAEKDDRSFSQYINLILKKHIEQLSGRGSSGKRSLKKRF
ncbi:MAG: ribbon-helix-helix protein, CopG family [Clostridia bacterium]|nr:ribbon-helix-helix protein, CopG family [Clostridia bacterium]